MMATIFVVIFSAESLALTPRLGSTLTDGDSTITHDPFRENPDSLKRRPSYSNQRYKNWGKADLDGETLPWKAYWGWRRIGFHSGVGTSDVSGYDVGEDSEPGRCHFAGFYVTYQYNKKIAVNPELNFLYKSGRYSTTRIVYDQFGNFAYRANSRTDWSMLNVEVPVLLSVRSFEPNQALQIFFDFGPDFIFALRDKTDDEVDITMNVRYRDEIDFSPPHVNFGAMEVAFVVGMGGEIKTDIGLLTMKLRFYAGMTNTGSGADDVTTHTFSFFVGYALPMF